MKKYVKIFFLELIIVFIVFLYIFNNKKAQDLQVDFDDIISNEQIEELDDSASISTDQITEIEDEDKDELDKRLETALINGDSQVNVNVSSLFVEANKIFSILEYISYENPEIMYYKGAEYSFGKVKLFYSKENKEIEEHRKEIRNIKREFFENNIDKNMSDYEKILSIHDYILESGQYDSRLFLEGEVPPESYSTYGILVLGVGVCESYAKSMKYLLDGAGIDSMVVIGKSRGENHAWNLVKIEDEYYHIDPTWNDPIVEDGSQLIRYNFFNLNDEQIAKTHDWDRDAYPQAKGKKYNYYDYNNLTAIGNKQLKDKIRKALLNREADFSVRVSNLDEDIDVNNIIEAIGFLNYEEIMLKEYSYYLDEEQNILSFQFYYY